MFKSIALTAITILTATAAQADGFICKTLDADYSIKVYNHTDPSQGTRNASVMIISDNNIADGNKTVAVFKDINETLTNSGSEFEAEVDLRYNDSGRKGENVFGTKLKYIDTITLTVAHSYSKPVADGKKLAGVLGVAKRNGELQTEIVSCKRYLKN